MGSKTPNVRLAAVFKTRKAERNGTIGTTGIPFSDLASSPLLPLLVVHNSAAPAYSACAAVTAVAVVRTLVPQTASGTVSATPVDHSRCACSNGCGGAFAEERNRCTEVEAGRADGGTDRMPSSRR